VRCPVRSRIAPTPAPPTSGASAGGASLVALFAALGHLVGMSRDIIFLSRKTASYLVIFLGGDSRLLATRGASKKYFNPDGELFKRHSSIKVDPTRSWSALCLLI
jgi:hypothetical protein